jgi:hypothetical protein
MALAIIATTTLALSVIVDSLFDDAEAIITVTRSQTKINSCIGVAQCSNTGTLNSD